MEEKFKFLEHTKDIKFQAFGGSLGECFTNAGLALKEIICKGNVKGDVKKVIKVKARDKESLLYDFLEEFLYFIDIGGFLVSRIENLKIVGLSKIRNKIKRYDWVLSADVFGDSVKNYSVSKKVKGIINKDLFVRQDRINGQTQFVCQVVVDI
jgi:SHS2 domain-containing protein